MSTSTLNRVKKRHKLCRGVFHALLNYGFLHIKDNDRTVALLSLTDWKIRVSHVLNSKYPQSSGRHFDRVAGFFYRRAYRRAWLESRLRTLLFGEWTCSTVTE